MSGIDELNERRAKEAERIRLALNRQRGIARANIKGGEGSVAFVKEELCIGCISVTLFVMMMRLRCIKRLRSPLMKVESNQKAKIIRRRSTGCRLCVLACPTDAIIMIDR